jgi:tetratricopeptide (TPR) repeat protein
VSPDERTEAESQADRALRRGELSTALSLYQAIATAFPTDEAVQVKLKRIRENLQPMELTSAKARPPIEQAKPPTNSIQSAEALAARGDYAQAIALYRKALEKRPDSDLIRERLAELFQIAQAIAPRASAATSDRTGGEPPTRSLTPSRGHFHPTPNLAESQAPVSTLRLLSDLLDQISRRRRSPPQRG